MFRFQNEFIWAVLGLFLTIIVILILRELFAFVIIKSTGRYDEYKREKDSYKAFFPFSSFLPKKIKWTLVLVPAIIFLIIYLCNFINNDTYYDRYQNEYSKQQDVIFYDETGNQYQLDKDISYLKINGKCVDTLYVDCNGYVVDLANVSNYISEYIGIVYSKETKQIYFIPASVYWNEKGIMYYRDSKQNIPVTEICYDDVT